MEELSGLAGDDHDTKMRGLYVDYDNGAVLDPADVTEREVQRMVSNLCTCLGELALLMDIEQMSDFASFLASQLTPASTEILSTEDGAMGFLQGVWDMAHVGGPPRPPWELFLASSQRQTVLAAFPPRCSMGVRRVAVRVAVHDGISGVHTSSALFMPWSEPCRTNEDQQGRTRNV